MQMYGSIHQIFLLFSMEIHLLIVKGAYIRALYIWVSISFLKESQLVRDNNANILWKCNPYFHVYSWSFSWNDCYNKWVVIFTW